MKLIIALLVALPFLLAVSIEDDTRQQFKDFMLKYGKSYRTPAEVAHRLGVFKDNLKRAEELSQRDPLAQYGVTKFMDLTPEEFADYYLIKNFTELAKATERRYLPKQTYNTTIPEGPFDWRNAGVVTGVYNQGQCGSCWAFSTTENIESMWARAGHGLGNLAMQQLVDCDHGDSGCNGGLPARAYVYIEQAGGLDSYSSYPYTAVGGQCRFNPGAVAARIANWGYISQNDDESEIQQWTYANGPPSVCVDAQTWQYYNGGVVGASCGQSIDHCVQLTGWNTVSGVNAWTVRNSWGTDWGYGGYIYVQMGINACAIGDYVSSSVI